VEIAERKAHYVRKVRQMEVRMKTEPKYREEQDREKNSDYKRVG